MKNILNHSQFFSYYICQKYRALREYLKHYFNEFFRDRSKINIKIFHVPQLVADPFCSIRKKNFRYYDAKTYSQCRSLFKPSMCVPFNGRQRRSYLYQTRLLNHTPMGICSLHRRIQIHNAQCIRLYIELEGSKLNECSIINRE